MILYLLLALWLYRRHRRGKAEDREETPENLTLYGSVFFLIASLFSLYELVRGQKHPAADGLLLLIALGFGFLFIRAERQSARMQRRDLFDDEKDRERRELLDLPRNSIQRYRFEKTLTSKPSPPDDEDSPDNETK